MPADRNTYAQATTLDARSIPTVATGVPSNLVVAGVNIDQHAQAYIRNHAAFTINDGRYRPYAAANPVPALQPHNSLVQVAGMAPMGAPAPHRVYQLGPLANPPYGREAIGARGNPNAGEQLGLLGQPNVYPLLARQNGRAQPNIQWDLAEDFCPPFPVALLERAMFHPPLTRATMHLSIRRQLSSTAGSVRMRVTSETELSVTVEGQNGGFITIQRFFDVLGAYLRQPLSFDQVQFLNNDLMAGEKKRLMFTRDRRLASDATERRSSESLGAHGDQLSGSPRIKELDGDVDDGRQEEPSLVKREEPEKTDRKSARSVPYSASSSHRRSASIVGGVEGEIPFTGEYMLLDLLCGVTQFAGIAFAPERQDWVMFTGGNNP